MGNGKEDLNTLGINIRTVVDTIRDGILMEKSCLNVVVGTHLTEETKRCMDNILCVKRTLRSCIYLRTYAVYDTCARLCTGLIREASMHVLPRCNLNRNAL